MHKILVIIPYFGRLPNYFQAFLNSCRNSAILDFLLLTDDQSLYEFPENFKVIYQDFDQLKNIIHLKFGKSAYADLPYKLCDYKSLYGYLFEEHLQDYQFWAHSDIDLLFGDVDSFLKKINYEEYDRVFPHGHFSIYKKDTSIMKLFLSNPANNFPQFFDFNFVKKTTYPCHFDEIAANIILKENNKKFFEKSFHANTHVLLYNFLIGGGNSKVPELMVYENGKIFQLQKKDQLIERHEYMYIHLQGKKLTTNYVTASDSFIICRDGFIDATPEELDHYFLKYGDLQDKHLQEAYSRALNKQLNKGKWNKLKREIKTYPFRFGYNLFIRLKGIAYLKKNNLF